MKERSTFLEHAEKNGLDLVRQFGRVDGAVRLRAGVLENPFAENKLRKLEPREM